MEKYNFSSYKDIEKLFSDKGYSTAEWEQGIQEVPPIYLQKIPHQWRAQTANKMNATHKKELFFRLLLPSVLFSNQQVATDRAALVQLQQKDTYTDVEKKWLLTLGKKYRVDKQHISAPLVKHLEALLLRVDTVPPSLALAQGADESGWGTSRFAEEANALYGQWTWNQKGVAAKGHQKGKGNYKVAAFHEPLDSVAAYMLNLNTQQSYTAFRNKRAQLCNQGKIPTGLDLVDTLNHYSQRGEAYVHDLKQLINQNNLIETDTARLMQIPAIELIPEDSQK